MNINIEMVINIIEIIRIIENIKNIENTRNTENIKNIENIRNIENIKNIENTEIIRNIENTENQKNQESQENQEMVMIKENHTKSHIKEMIENIMEIDQEEIDHIIEMYGKKRMLKMKKRIKMKSIMILMMNISLLKEGIIINNKF